MGIKERRLEKSIVKGFNSKEAAGMPRYIELYALRAVSETDIM
jgi:hypothetical protein